MLSQVLKRSTGWGGHIVFLMALSLTAAMLAQALVTLWVPGASAGLAKLPLHEEALECPLPN